MKISNLRKEYKNKFAYLVADIECSFSKEKTFWFSLPEENANYFATDVYDSILMAFYYPAMYYGEDIIVEGNVSKRLYKNLKSYVYSIVLGYRPNFKKINIKVSGFVVANQTSEKIIGTGYSGGVDSFSTIVDHYVNECDPDYKINSLFFFHLGQYGDITNPQTRIRAQNRYKYCKEATDFMELPYIYMDTNMFKFYQPRWEYYAGVFTRCAAILALQKVCKRYYVSGSHSFCQYAEEAVSKSSDLASYADPVIMPLLSTEVCEIVIDGCQYRRIDKIDLIKDYEPAQKYLNVCVNCSDDRTSADNCGFCGKCTRTLFAIDAQGVSDKFANVFKLDAWRKIRNGYVLGQRFLYGKDTFATENINMARQNNIYIPSYIVSCVYVFCYEYPRKIINRIISI